MKEARAGPPSVDDAVEAEDVAEPPRGGRDAQAVFECEEGYEEDFASVEDRSQGGRQTGQGLERKGDCRYQDQGNDGPVEDAARCRVVALYDVRNVHVVPLGLFEACLFGQGSSNAAASAWKTVCRQAHRATADPAHRAGRSGGRDRSSQVSTALRHTRRRGSPRNRRLGAEGGSQIDGRGHPLLHPTGGDREAVRGVSRRAAKSRRENVLELRGNLDDTRRPEIGARRMGSGEGRVTVLICPTSTTSPGPSDRSASSPAPSGSSSGPHA